MSENNGAVIAAAIASTRSKVASPEKAASDLSTLHDAIVAESVVDRAIAESVRSVEAATTSKEEEEQIKREHELVSQKQSLEAAVTVAARSVSIDVARAIASRDNHPLMINHETGEPLSPAARAIHQLAQGLAALDSAQDVLEKDAEGDAERSAALPAGSGPDKESISAALEKKLAASERLTMQKEKTAEKIAFIAAEALGVSGLGKHKG